MTTSPYFHHVHKFIIQASHNADPGTSPFAIVVGVPARVLLLRVDEGTAQRLQRIAWWDWSPERIDTALADLRALTAEQFAEKYDRSRVHRHLDIRMYRSILAAS